MIAVMHILLPKDLLLLQAEIIEIQHLKKCSFIACISKINNVLIDNVEDLDAVMPTLSVTN